MIELRIALVLVSAVSLPALAVEQGATGITFDVLNYAEQRFDMGVVDDDWSAGHRYELDVMTQLAPGRAAPSAGGYVFYEEHDWQGAQHASADYTCWGFGLQAGAALQLV